MQTTGYALQFLQTCWTPNGDTDFYYRHFRDAFYTVVLGKLQGKKVPNSSQHLKCCVRYIFPLAWGGPNAPLVSAIPAVKALLL